MGGQLQLSRRDHRQRTTDYGPRTTDRKPRRQGMVLVVVLVVVMILSLAALTFGQLMMAEWEAAELSARQIQSRALADSGLEMARLAVSEDAETSAQAGGCYDNQDRFGGVLVVDGTHPRQRGRFAIVAPAMNDGRFEGVRFGVEDESAKLNLNVLAAMDNKEEYKDQNIGRQLLMALPGMTEETADAILDWIDIDAETREFGAEEDYYATLDPPYWPKNGPLETVEELLLVRGVTPQLLFGVDANRNGMADRGEPDPMSIADADNSDGSLDRGWSAYLTLWSAETNLRPDGTPKIDVNQEDMQKLYDELVAAIPEPYATFIVAYRQNGPDSSGKLGELVTGELDRLTESSTKYKLTTILDLVGKTANARFKGSNNDTVVLASPFPDGPIAMKVYLPTLMDNLSVNPSPIIPGRINVNQASRTVLMGIPGMDQEIVDAIVSQRQQDLAQAEPDHVYETWIMAEGIVDLDEMKALMPFVCGSGSVYKAQSVGYFDQDGPDARVEAILDATKRPARVLFWREISHLGRGYPREQLGIEAAE